MFYPSSITLLRQNTALGSRVLDPLLANEMIRIHSPSLCRQQQKFTIQINKTEPFQQQRDSKYNEQQEVRNQEKETIRDC